MIVLTALSFIGGILAFVLITLSIASGLYYVSEFVEEHASFSKRCIRYAIYVVCSILILSLFDGLPWHLILFALASQAIYYSNLKDFPVIQLGSGRFIAACVLVFVNHYLWFRAFGQMQKERRSVGFGQVASFFGICVWLVPFSLFVSLSAGDNMLPSVSNTANVSSDNAASGYDLRKGRKKAGGLVKASYSWIGAQIQPVLQSFGIQKEDPLLTSHGRYA